MSNLKEKTLWTIFVVIWMCLLLFIILIFNNSKVSCITIYKSHVKVLTTEGDTADIHSDTILIKKYK